MAEGSLHKVRRMVMGSVADAVEAAEARNPSLVMREAVREMQRAVDRVRVELGRVSSRRFQAARQEGHASAKVAELALKANEAIAAGRADLAEALISRQIDLEAQIVRLGSDLKELVETERDLQAALAELETRKSDMSEEVAALQFSPAASPGVEPGDTGDPSSETQIRVAAATEAFDRAKRVLGASLNSSQSDSGVNRRIAEFDALARRREIQVRLTNLSSDAICGPHS